MNALENHSPNPDEPKGVIKLLCGKNDCNPEGEPRRSYAQTTPFIPHALPASHVAIFGFVRCFPVGRHCGKLTHICHLGAGQKLDN